MKRRFLQSIMITALLLPIGKGAEASWFSSKPDCSSKEYSTKELTKRSKPGVVMIVTDKAAGSGFVVRHIKDQTLILTNSHVMKDANKITVEWPDGNQDSAVVVLDGGNTTTLTDLSLLMVHGKEGKVLPLKQEQAIVGGDVIAIGAPQGLSFTLTKGVISSLRDQGRIIQTDTAINPGSSGGPLINSSGCVVGVNTLASKNDVGLNFAISSQTAQRFIDKYNPDTNRKSKLKSQSDDNQESKKKKKVDKLTDAREYATRGKKKYESGDYKGAISDLDKAIRIDPYSSIFYAMRASYKATIKDDDGAMLDVNKAISINPELGVSYSLRSALYSRAGDKDKMFADLNKAIEVDPGNDVRYVQRGRKLYDSGDYSSALADYDKAIAINPSSIDAYTYRIKIKEKLKDYKGTIPDLDKLLDLTPFDADAYYQRAWFRINISRKRRNLSKPLEDLNMAISINPNHSRAYTLRSFVNFTLKGRRESCMDKIEAYKIAVEDRDFYLTSRVSENKRKQSEALQRESLEKHCKNYL